MGFPYAFRVCDADELATYLSDIFAGEVTVMDWDYHNVQNFLMDITPEQLAQIREQGGMEYTVPFTEWEGTQERELGTLTFTVIKENDTYKVSDYTFTPAQ